MAIPLGSSPPAFIETVEEIIGIYRSLPRRPTIDEVEAAMVVIETVENEERQRMEEVSRMEEPEGVPKELFRVLQEMRSNLIMLQSHEQRKEALFLLKRDKMFEAFDQLIQRASAMLVSSGGHRIQVGGFAHETPVMKGERKKETSYEKAMSGVPARENEKQKSVVSVDSMKPALVKDGDFFGEEPEKLSLINVASLIEASQRSGVTELDLQGKLVDQMEWLPVSLGKLSNLVTLSLAENRIMALP